MERKKRHLVLVRHGESVWNKKGLWTGWIDVGLTLRGKEEARLAAMAISDITVDLAYTSDLKRSRQTLKIMLSTMKIDNISVISHPAYKERHYGIYTGKNKWEIEKIVGKDQFKRIRRYWDEPIPQGETLKDVYERVIPHFEKEVLPMIINGKNVLIVAHGNTHRALIKYLENISHEEIANVELTTGEVIVYELDKSGKVVRKEKRLTKTL